MNSPEELKQLQKGKIYVAGHRGMVGSAIVRRLKHADCNNLLLVTRSELDLTDGNAVRAFMHAERPDYIFLAAAKVGGINANNTYPAQFIYQNLMIAANIIDSAQQVDVHRLLFLGSSCIYPKMAPQPMPESCLLTGPLESTNEPYAIAKIAGIKLCESYNREYKTDYRSAMPTNLYGSHDNFDLKTSHVLPALIRKFHEANESGVDVVEVWGSGNPRREFLHVDDLADACLHLMLLPYDTYWANTDPMQSHLNVGSGKDLSIADLASVIQRAVGFEGTIRFNPEFPDGTQRKLLDVSALKALGWQAQIELADGIASTYKWYIKNNC